MLELPSEKTMLILFLLFTLATLLSSLLLEDPIKCSSGTKNCTITNAYGVFPDRTLCLAAEVMYPQTEDDLISTIAKATKNKRKVKVATRFSHSIPKLVCPDGENGLLVSTKLLNRVIEIDKYSMTMTVESGLSLRELIDKASEVGLALPYTPYWWGLSIGGLLSTGAHGSSLLGQSSVHDHVVEIRIVTPAGPEDGYAKVRTLDNNDPDIDAVKVSLGVLGVISQVSIRLQPMFKRSIIFSEESDSDLGDQVVSFGKKHEFADITWYPSQGKAVFRIDDRVVNNVFGNGLFDVAGFRSIPTVQLEVMRNIEENQELRGDALGKCINAKLTAGTIGIRAYGLTNNGVLFIGYPVVGYQNRLQSSGSCLDNSPRILSSAIACPWDHRIKGLFFHQTTFSIGLSKVKSFIKDVQDLVNLEPQSLCVVELYNGVLMRYVKASTAYLGKQEDAIDFDFTYYRSEDPMIPRLYEDIIEEIEQIGLFKYGGLPHWGKNRNVGFDRVIKKYKNASEFLKVKEEYDPVGIFSSDWTDRVLGLKGNGDVMIVKEGCGLEGLCLCSEDAHCAPSRGYYCRPGRIYKDARICTTRSTSI